MSRRAFLKIAGVACAVSLGYAILNLTNLRRNISKKLNLKGSIESHDPIYTKNSLESPNNRVVAVHDSNATNWDFSTGWYGDYVDQSIVDEMVNTGIMELTETKTIGDAWRTLIPNYVSGEKIAIKVNFNDSSSYNDSHNKIDALMHPINPIIAGLKKIGVQEPDIWIYDALRPIPNRFINKCIYKGILYYDFFGLNGRNKATFNSTSSESNIKFSNKNIRPHKLTDVITNANYVINIPIIKRHGGSGVTLSMKNHLGSLNPSTRTSIENIPDIHDYIYLYSKNYNSNYNPLVDININPNIKNKIVLIVGDGLYGNWYSNNQEPRKWKTFNNKALNTLFFSRNPVVIDSVMYDFLSAETFIDHGSDDYLHIAARNGLGIHEHKSKDNTYNLIDYVDLNFDNI